MYALRQYIFRWLLKYPAIPRPLCSRACSDRRRDRVSEGPGSAAHRRQRGYARLRRAMALRCARKRSLSTPIAAADDPEIDLGHEQGSRKPPRHCRSAAQPDRRRCRRQSRTRPRGARAGRARGRRHRRLLRTFHRRLSAGGFGAQAGVPGRLPRRCRDLGARHRRRRPRRADGDALGRRRQALQCLCAARSRGDRGDPLQGQSAELRRVRRKARVRPGSGAGAGRVPRRASRPADLRGHLDRLGRLRERGRNARRNRRRTPRRAQRLALLARQGRCPPQRHGGAGRRGRPAAHLCQSGRRPGRTGVRRRLVRAQCRPLDGVPAAGIPGGDADHAVVARQ